MQQEELERLPGWSWNPRQEKWDRHLDALRRFAELNGHANPSRTSEDPGERALATWKRNNKTKLQGRTDTNAHALRQLLKTYGENMP
ncbi:helicase associated domain-containing protein [Streptomyces sp. NPDC059385]|uniref:helicase associated domain-containing protein n=1 Tax=Streptomyces sp. NPDC059385 TaxID=3346817 RepID=UPI0036A2B2E9